MAKKLLAKHPEKEIYCEGGRVYKVFSSDFPKDEVFHEAFINTRAENICGDCVPKVFSVSEKDGKWVLEKEYVPGKTLKELMQENPKKIDEYLERMLEIQLAIQSYKAPVLEQLKSKLQRQINELAEIDAGTRYELMMRLENTPKHEKLCHGDLRPGNIVIDAEGKYHILDWVHAAKGNASADIARTYLILALEDKETAEKYLTRFCEKTDTRRSYVEKWMPIVAAARLTKKCSEKEEAELRSWLQICDHM